jgi:hypothetical protein
VPLLPFAQLDLPGALGLADGRYLVREEGPGADGDPDVLVLLTIGAQRARSRLRRGRPVAVEPQEGATPLPLSRVTLIKARPLSGREQAEQWLARVSGDRELAAGLARETAAVLNRALLAHRVAAPDPYTAAIEPGAASVIRLGFGSGDELAVGRWSAARELPERERRGLRRRALDSVGASERVAAVLGGRDRVAAEEALLSHARLALAEERCDEAALLLAAAAEALGRRLRSEAAAGAQSEAMALREQALAGPPPDAEAVRECMRGLTRALRES